ncbi:hypothetical protein [Aureliella helgolandensis]|uniref:Acyl carrier protein phosphodiesterase n=1 Tax=Aureliella helgolandensis TaxID=2527968 RepID=A0A518GHI5_9BACT|nr:hypothetical protein [Aureliella helgolandensis]QDV28059.1 hypothetical protein Q31a_64520 [Aureliella helgolandensis]
MNYLGHAYLHLDNPYFAAGTALPDWLNVIDRKNRARRQYAEPITKHADPLVACFARGVMRHHYDDNWFHQTAAFARLSTQFAVDVRQLLPSGLGHQAGFVGHISVELLLDAILCERDPQLLDTYYDMLRGLDAERVQMAANLICPRPLDTLAILIPKFIHSRFLADYHDDGLLRQKLNGVMQRVKLPLLPETLTPWLAVARNQVRESADELLTSTLK